MLERGDSSRFAKTLARGEDSMDLALLRGDLVCLYSSVLVYFYDA